MIFGQGLTMEEKVASLFQPDPLLPAQYFETFRRRGPIVPELRLMLAVLEDGIACFQKYGRAQYGSRSRLFHEASAWILERDSDCFFSFENICSALELDAHSIRRALKAERSIKAKDGTTPRSPKKARRKRKYRFAA